MKKLDDEIVALIGRRVLGRMTDDLNASVIAVDRGLRFEKPCPRCKHVIVVAPVAVEFQSTECGNAIMCGGCLTFLSIEDNQELTVIAPEAFAALPVAVRTHFERLRNRMLDIFASAAILVRKQ